MDFKTIILDFDGVLVESVGIKDKAFEVLFSAFSEKFNEIINYHLSHNAVIRYEKFRYIYEEILKEKYTDEIKDDLCLRYSEIIVQKIIECPCVKGSIEFLEYFYGKVPLYIISINPLEELKYILQSRGLLKYFKEIYAHPWKKSDAIVDILRKEGIGKKQAVFIGDSPEDYASAKEAGIFFVGIKSNKSFNDADMPLCDNLIEVKKLISK